jgi:hypothetical protein
VLLFFKLYNNSSLSDTSTNTGTALGTLLGGFVAAGVVLIGRLWLLLSLVVLIIGGEPLSSATGDGGGEPPYNFFDKRPMHRCRMTLTTD